MYTKKELIENKIIENAIHENYKKQQKKYKRKTITKILDFIFYLTACSVFFFGLMFLIAVIEHIKF